MSTTATPTSAQPPPHWLARASPFLKIGLWFAFTLAATALVQLLLWAVGLQERMFGESGRTVLLPVALVALMALAIYERRSAADYGLAFPVDWAKQLRTGLAIGLGFGVAYFVVCWLSGAMGWPGTAKWRDWLDPFWIVPAVLIVAFAHQLIFSGYFYSIFRERYGRVAGVIATALVFPVLSRVDTPDRMLSGPGWRAEIGMLLAQALLATLRVGSGNILLSGGVLAGFLIPARIVEQTHLLDRVPDSALMPWLAYHGDPRQSPAFWALTAAALLVAIVVAKRHAAEPAPAAIPASLKRVYPLAMPMCLALLSVQLRCLGRARWRVGPEYVLRLIGMLVLSGINELICLPERILAPLIARRRPEDPIFILGVHRSGTTHLHNLLALDPNLIAPRNHHVLNPAGALICGWPMSALLAAFIPWQRPMDAMQFHIGTPNEEEFAIACQSHLSPYWGWAFPEQGAEYDRFLRSDGFTASEAESWKNVNRAFLRKLVFWSKRRPVLKNPCNTGRLSMLLEMFPSARIVHIHRHPFDVVRSNRHFFREGHVLWQLQNPPAVGTYADRFLDNYAMMERAFEEQSRGLPPNRLVSVGFEDLERDPLGVIRRIYGQLELPFTARFRLNLRNYLKRVRGYQKNRFNSLPSDEREQVLRAVGDLMQRWNYHAG